MRIGYLMNSYPMTSTTFIRREIEALEGMGMRIHRYAVRPWGEQLVDPADVLEINRTSYLLTDNIKNLIKAFFLMLIFQPRSLLKGVVAWWRICRNAGSIKLRHFAYLLQAIYFCQRASKDDLPHVHVHFSTNATTVAFLSYMMGGPGYSFTAHGPDEFVEAAALSMDLKVRHARFVVAISNYSRVQIVRFSSFEFWDKIVIARCGLNLAEFIPNYKFNIDNQNLVCVGRLCSQKAQVLLPQAVAIVKADFPDLCVHLIGDGESRTALEAEIKRYGVERNFVLHGWAASSEVRRQVADARAFLLPSLAEGLPVSILEAFALGRPVISTYIAGIPELLDDTCGWIVPAGSVEEIAVAMCAALQATPATLEEMGREGRSRVEAQHDLGLIGAILIKEFSKYAKA